MKKLFYISFRWEGTIISVTNNYKITITPFRWFWLVKICKEINPWVLWQDLKLGIRSETGSVPVVRVLVLSKLPTIGEPGWAPPLPPLLLGVFLPLPCSLLGGCLERGVSVPWGALDFFRIPGQWWAACLGPVVLGTGGSGPQMQRGCMEEQRSWMAGMMGEILMILD